ncbi:MAG: ArsB/NhaD family transporter [Patescibacteria group bacterium]|nr:ArsB/NhaD family transporter [Patescibacteria group bacterium]
MESSSINFIPFVSFLILLIILISEKFNRSIITGIFAIFFVVFSLIDFEKAIESIDFNTIGLLIGMMIIVSIIAKTGIFQFLAIKMLKLAKGRPVRLMIYLSLLTAFLSAFLDNVTTILLITPVTLYITKILGISAFSIILSLIYFSNIGGTATLIGDPPNIIIGSEANLSFNDFLIYNGPIVVINIFISLILIYFMFKNKLREKKVSLKLIKKIKEQNLIKDKIFLIKSLIILFLVILGFLTHNITKIENSIIALAGAFLMLLTTTKEPDHIYKEIEWSSIFFFIGLFIIIGSIEHSGVLDLIARKIIDFTDGNVELTSYAILSFVGLISGFVDNIPITVVFSKIIKEISSSGVDIFPLWWALSLGACFGGNMTLIGASANIVGIDIYNKNLNDNNENNKTEKINFGNFMKYGFLITIISLLISLFYLKLIFFLNK